MAGERGVLLYNITKKRKDFVENVKKQKMRYLERKIHLIIAQRPPIINIVSKLAKSFTLFSHVCMENCRN